MPNEALPKLNDRELITLCGTLLRAMRADRAVTAEECDVLVSIVAEVLAASTPSAAVAAYREPAATEQEPDKARVAAEGLIDRAAKQFPDDASLRAALAEVTRPEAQRLIYDAVFSLVATDSVSSSEQSFLDELRVTWKLATAAD